MAITQNILNLDAYYRATPGDKVIINDLKYFSKDKEHMLDGLKTIYKSDIISTKPSCDCGKLQGRYRINKVCSDCGTKCMEVTYKVKPFYWMKAIRPDLKFMNPVIWTMLKNVLSTKNQDYMRWLCDTRYNPPVNIPQDIINILEVVMKGERSYTNLVNNIPNILIYLLNIPKYKHNEVKQKHLRTLYDLYVNNVDQIYSEYLPIINKKLFVVEQTSKGKYINLDNYHIIDVAVTWLNLCSVENPTEKRLSNTMGVVLSNLSSLFISYLKDYVAKKAGLFRKHVYGARSHFTFRNVIVSRTGKHDLNSVEVPWFVGVTAFRPHVINKLFKRGYDFKTINKMLYRAVKKYDPIIDEVLKELIAEAPNGKLPILTQRNPSLKQGSSQLVYIDRFNTEPMNMCLKISPLICKAPNADFDGESSTDYALRECVNL